MACVQTEAITIVVVITCIVFICSVVAIEGWAFRLTLCQNHILFLCLSLSLSTIIHRIRLVVQ